MVEPFTQRAWAVVRRIPRGRVLGYRDVAALAGNALAARQAGAAMKKAPRGVPWWRVVASDGRIRTGAEGERRLRAEGVEVVNGRVRMAQRRWSPSTDPPKARPRSRAHPRR